MTEIEDHPRSWTRSSVGEVANYQNGRAFKPTEWGDKGLPIIRIQNLNDPSAIYNYSDIQHEKRFLVKNGDLLFAWSASLGAYLWRGQEAWLNQHIYRVDHTKVIDRQFLFYALTNITNDLYAKAHGSGMVHVTKGRFEETPIWLPPLNEQHRIVLKIDELFSELDKGIESLKAARAKLDVYRQSVLKHAFEGKLTAKWREENKDLLDTPERLLNRIKQERDILYKQQIQEWKKLVEEWELDRRRGRKPRKPSFPNSSAESTNNFKTDLDTLPHSWTWAEIRSLFEVVSGATPKGLDRVKGNDIPFYKVADMNTTGNETWMDISKIYLSESEKRELGLTMYPKGTVIFPKRGGAILTNKKRILSRSSCFDLNTMGVVNSIECISHEYLWYWFQSLDLTKIYDGSNVPQINNKNIGPLPFPVCSIEEQYEVARILGKVIPVVEEMAANISEESKKAEALRQCILKKAFAGQLVPQDSNDEPASV